MFSLSSGKMLEPGVDTLFGASFFALFFHLLAPIEY